MNEKIAIRRRMREALAGLTSEELAVRSEQIRLAILSSELWRNARSVCLFASLPIEPNIDPLLDLGIRGGKELYYPRVAGQELELVPVSSADALEITRWNLREPKKKQPARDTVDGIDLILVPGIAFSKSGSRLGRGGGFYDRLLSRLPADRPKAGVCFEIQIVPDLPQEVHDQDVGYLVTESGLRRCSAE